MNNYIYNTTPAADFAEGYPTGNGRLGSMVISKGENERQALNHDLLWRGYIGYKKTRTSGDIDEIKSLCRQKRFGEAERLLLKTQPETGRTLYINPFVPAGDMYIRMEGKAENYKRTLVLSQGLALTEYDSGGVKYRRETLSSATDGIILTHLSSDRAACLCGSVSLSRIDDCECTVTSTASPDTLTLSGTFDEGGTFAAAVRLYNRGGRLSLLRREYRHDEKTSEKPLDLKYVFSREEWYDADNGIETAFAHADEVIIAAVVSTDTESAVLSLSPTEYNARKLSEFERKYGAVCGRWDEILSAHTEAFGRLYCTQDLQIGTAENRSNEELLSECEKTGRVSAELAQKLYCMSRYLTLSAGMPSPAGEYPTAPINLQGLWCQDLFPAWESDYHMDLNLVMCYWSAAQLGLECCYSPLMEWVKRLSPQARELANDLYGCRGVAFNGCCDYKTIGSTDNVGYFWLGGAAWLCDILWRRYEFTADRDFLARELLPFMSEVSDFFTDMLEPKDDGRLYPPFGSSPEFTVIHGGERTFAFGASTIDIELIHALFSHLDAAYEIVGKDARTVRNRVILARLPLPSIKADGTLSEFCDTDYAEAEPGHRHRSPLVGLCPGERVSVEFTPEYADASYKLIRHRVENGKSVSQAFAYSWDTQLLARLGKAEEAYERLCLYAKIHLLPNLLSTGNDYAQKHGGLSWFVGTKLFQIEACISVGAGLLDMIFSCRQSVMRFLPALPDEFGDGRAVSFASHGSFEVSFEWKSGRVTHISILSKLGGECRMILPESFPTSSLPSGASVDSGIAVFPTVAGGVYELRAVGK